MKPMTNASFAGPVLSPERRVCGAGSERMQRRGNTGDRCCGYSLVEIMVAMTLLTVIVVGLMLTLNQTQRALRASGAQTDTLENGRAFLSLLSREMGEVVNFHDSVTNAYRFAAIYRPSGGQLQQTIPGGKGLVRTNELQSFCLVVPSKEINGWRAIFYDFRESLAARHVVDIYRAERSFQRWQLTNNLAELQRSFFSGTFTPDRNTNDFSKMLSGVIHLRFQAYDRTNGYPVVPLNGAGNRPRGYFFANPANIVPQPPVYFPDSVEVELGLLDSDTYKRSKAIENTTTLETFLADRAANVQLFRQRITISTGP